MTLPKARVAMPQQARRGDVIEVRTLIRHPMETGFRRDENGLPLPRNIIQSLSVAYNNTEVFRMQMHPAVSANPFVQFWAVAQESGEFVFTWTDDKGGTTVERRMLTVVS